MRSSSRSGLVGLVSTACFVGLIAACAGGETGGFATTPDAGLDPNNGNLGGADPARCHDANDIDDDGDGYSESQGDCNDCDPAVNPGAFDAPGDRIDNDCSGAVDDDAACDTGLALDASDPFDAARAMGLCRRADFKARSWGVVSAKWVRPDGTGTIDPLSYGIVPTFGANRAQDGAAMLALSTGTARTPDMPGYHDISGYQKGYTSGAPAGYPKESPACPGVKTGAVHDGAALEVQLRVPTNARSYSVDESFFTLEFPGYVCSKYNDFFVVDMQPKPDGYADGNVAFDSVGNPISVNNALLQVCKPQTVGARTFACPLGTDSLAGTGFDTVEDVASPAPHGGTGWLTTRAPVAPGSTITLRFAIWDSADGNLDSTVLIDHFAWSTAAGAGTVPSQNPK